MKITLLDKKPKFVIKMDLAKFKKTYREHLDLELSVLKSMTMISKEEDIKTRDVEQMVFLKINWGRILTFMKPRDREMTIQGYLVMLKDVVEYTPEYAVPGSSEYTFKTTTKDRVDYLVTHTAIPLMEHHVETLIADGILDYSLEGWKLIIDMK